MTCRDMQCRHTQSLCHKPCAWQRQRVPKPNLHGTSAAWLVDWLNTLLLTSGGHGLEVSRLGTALLRLLPAVTGISIATETDVTAASILLETRFEPRRAGGQPRVLHRCASGGRWGDDDRRWSRRCAFVFPAPIGEWQSWAIGAQSWQAALTVCVTVCEAPEGMTSSASFAGHCKVVHAPDVLIDSGFETACARHERGAHSATRSHQRGAFANANAARHVRAKCAGAGCIRWSQSPWPGPAARGMRLHGKRRARRPGSRPSRAWAHVCAWSRDSSAGPLRVAAAPGGYALSLNGVESRCASRKVCGGGCSLILMA